MVTCKIHHPTPMLCSRLTHTGCSCNFVFHSNVYNIKSHLNVSKIHNTSMYFKYASQPRVFLSRVSTQCTQSAILLRPICRSVCRSVCPSVRPSHGYCINTNAHIVKHFTPSDTSCVTLGVIRQPPQQSSSPVPLMVRGLDKTLAMWGELNELNPGSQNAAKAKSGTASEC